MSAEPINVPEGQGMEMAELMRLARRRPLTIADLVNLNPTVGRTELIDGNLIVTPAPDFEHQDLCHDLVAHFNALLRAGGFTGVRAASAVNVFEPGSDKSLFIPDVIVADRSKTVRIHGAGEGIFPDGILCAVEVTSSNADVDLRLKRDRYLSWQIPYLVVNRTRQPYRYQVFGDWPAWAEPILDGPTEKSP